MACVSPAVLWKHWLPLAVGMDPSCGAEGAYLVLGKTESSVGGAAWVRLPAGVLLVEGVVCAVAGAAILTKTER